MDGLRTARRILERAHAVGRLLAAFNNVALLRQQLQLRCAVHGIITTRQAPNMIPERAAARLMVRAPDPVLLEKVYARVLDCARAGAMASGSRWTFGTSRRSITHASIPCSIASSRKTWSSWDRP